MQGVVSEAGFWAELTSRLFRAKLLVGALSAVLCCRTFHLGAVVRRSPRA